MKCFVVLSLISASLAAPATPIHQIHVNKGAPAGPLTAAFGDLIATPKGLRSYALEGFSEDLNQDGFVDPVGQAVVHHVAPVITYAAAPLVHPYAGAYYGHGLIAAPVAAPVAKTPLKAPVVTYGHAAPFYGHGFGYGYGLGLGHLGGFPFAAPVPCVAPLCIAPVAAAAVEESGAVEEARKKREADPEADALLFSYATGAVHPYAGAYYGQGLVAAPVAAPVAEVKTIATPLVHPYAGAYYGHRLIAAPVAAPIAEVKAIATPLVHPYAGAYYGHGLIAAPVPETPLVYAAAPVAAPVAATPLVYAAPALHHYTTPVVAQVPAVAYQTYTSLHPFTTVNKHVTTHTTRHIINHAPVIGAPIPFGVVAAAPVVATAPAEAASGVEEA